jgi:hypothetical protein
LETRNARGSGEYQVKLTLNFALVKAFCVLDAKLPETAPWQGSDGFEERIRTTSMSARRLRLL